MLVLPWPSEPLLYFFNNNEKIITLINASMVSLVLFLIRNMFLYLCMNGICMYVRSGTSVAL